MNKYLLLIVLGAVASVSASDTLVVLDPSDGGETLKGWQEKSFEGNTSYNKASDAERSFIKAIASSSASGLFLEKEIDLNAYPILNWRWRVDKGLTAHDEKVKEGDDFAARLYVVVSGGFFFWKTIALNYVWSSNQVETQAWPNPFAGDNAHMLAVRGDSDQLGEWYLETRNLKQDFKRLFGREVDTIDGLAIMTDTDNGGGAAEASYGEIFFSTK